MFDSDTIKYELTVFLKIVMNGDRTVEMKDRLRAAELLGILYELLGETGILYD